MNAKKYITSYLTEYKNAKLDWNYEDGCVLIGAVQLYEVTKNNFYKIFVKEYIDKFVNEDGSINHYEKEKYNIDNINTGKVLFFLYEETKETKYKLAIEVLMDQLRSHPRTKSNNFWHKKIYPNQIWLDGLYMAQPFYMAYETKFNGKKNYNDILEQFKNVRKFLFNEEKKLYYHGYDEARVQPWADKETGCSPNFWLRAVGWYLMALVDTMWEMSKEIFEQYRIFEGLLKEGVKGILPYRDEKNNMFYQIIDKGKYDRNYLETSGSLMVAYAILKGCRIGALQKEIYQEIGEDIFYAITEQKIIEEDGKLKLTDICSVAGLGPGNERDGSFEYYVSELVVCDDPKGSGVLLMTYAQLLFLKQEDCEEWGCNNECEKH